MFCLQGEESDTSNWSSFTSEEEEQTSSIASIFPSHGRDKSWIRSRGQSKQLTGGIGEWKVFKDQDQFTQKIPDITIKVKDIDSLFVPYGAIQLYNLSFLSEDLLQTSWPCHPPSEWDFITW